MTKSSLTTTGWMFTPKNSAKPKTVTSLVVQSSIVPSSIVRLRVSCAGLKNKSIFDGRVFSQHWFNRNLCSFDFRPN